MWCSTVIFCCFKNVLYNIERCEILFKFKTATQAVNMFIWGHVWGTAIWVSRCQHTKVAAKCSFGGRKYIKCSTIQETPNQLISQAFRKSVRKRKCTLKCDFSGCIPPDKVPCNSMKAHFVYRWFVSKTHCSDLNQGKQICFVCFLYDFSFGFNTSGFSKATHLNIFTGVFFSPTLSIAFGIVFEMASSV